MAQLKKPKNFRQTFPCVCAFCECHGNDGDGCWYCDRDIENVKDVGDGLDYERVCDYFKRPSYIEERR